MQTDVTDACTQVCNIKNYTHAERHNTHAKTVVSLENVLYSLSSVSYVHLEEGRHRRETFVESMELVRQRQMNASTAAPPQFHPAVSRLATFATESISDGRVFGNNKDTRVLRDFLEASHKNYRETHSKPCVRPKCRMRHFINHGQMYI